MGGKGRTAIALVVLFLLMVLLRKPLTGFIHYLGFPLWDKASDVEPLVPALSLRLSTKEQLREENKALTARVAELERTLIDYRILEEEAERLRGVFGRVTSPTELLRARVLRRPPLSPFDTMIIDVGFNHDVTSGDLVVVDDTIVIGSVIDVYGKTSVVELYSAPGRVTDVAIKDTIPAQAFGKGGGNFSIDVPRGVEVAPGDPVVLAGTDGKILGLVDSIVDTPTDSFRRILFRVPVNMYMIPEVFIIEPFIEAVALPDTSDAETPRQ